MARWTQRASNEERIGSPYDEQARSSRKRELVWLGYKVHLTQTCDQDPQAPHLIVQVHTVPATTPDSVSVEPILEDLRDREVAPSTLLMDQGYTSATSLVEQAIQGTQIVGPLHESTSWQAQAGEGYGLYDFAVDWQQRSVWCPASDTRVNDGLPLLIGMARRKLRSAFQPRLARNV
jgi:transposase